MVTVTLEASPRLKGQVHDLAYTTTEEDLPPETVQLAHYPRVGDDVYDIVTGSSWTVIRTGWPIDGKKPIVVVE